MVFSEIPLRFQGFEMVEQRLDSQRHLAFDFGRTATHGHTEPQTPVSRPGQFIEIIETDRERLPS